MAKGISRVMHATLSRRALLLASLSGVVMASPALAQDQTATATERVGTNDPVADPATSPGPDNRANRSRASTATPAAPNGQPRATAAIAERNAAARGKPRVKGAKPKRFIGAASNIVAEDISSFYGFSTFNGREVSSGTNLRDVSLRQFPADLTKNTLIRTQQTADMLEGAVFGVASVETVRPLDLKERRVSVELRGIYSSYADRTHQSPGRRISASYIDQFDTGIGRIGVSAGALISDSFLPKDFYKATTAVRPCNSIGAAGNCTFTPGSANPTYFATGSHTFRQQRSDENQRAYFGSLQWQPSSAWDINLDLERSSRIQKRYRSELSLTEGFRGITPLVIADSGAPLKIAGQSAVESLAFERTRDEKYTGGGLSVRYQAADNLSITGDISYSNTKRLQTDRSASVASNELFGPGGRVNYVLDLTHTDFPIINFATPTDLNNYAAFTANAAARRGRDTRNDTIKAARFDAVYDLGGVFSTLKAGIRYSDHWRRGVLRSFLSNNDIPMANVLAGNANCRRGPITDDFGKQAGTNIQSWAVFDPVCLYSTFTGSTDPDKPLTLTTGGGEDIHERILAGYVMSEFATELGGVPVSGNVGARIVETTTDTRVYRFTANSADLAGTRDRVGPVIDILPSINFVATPSRELQINAGVYRTLLRSAIDGFNLRRVVAGPAGIVDRHRPLKSWNIDLAFNYTPIKDTTLSLELNYKRLSSGAWPGDLIIPGGPVLRPELRDANEHGSYIRGVGVAAAHAFHWLPKPLDGLSVEASYAYTDSNFEFADPSATDPLNPLSNFTDPVGIPGLSKHVAAVSGQYDTSGYSLELSYEYRSGYFRPTGLTANRVLGAAGYLDAAASIELTKHASIRLSVANLTNAHEVLYRPVAESIGQTSYFGRTVQASLRFRY